jgi:hypothetical protein
MNFVIFSGGFQMHRWLKIGWVLLVLVLLAIPAQASVSGDIASGLPLDKVFDNGLRAGLAMDTIIFQCLDSGVEPCPLLKAALARGLDLTRIFTLLTDYCRNTLGEHSKDDPNYCVNRKDDPNWCEACATCNLFKCAVDAGKDPVEVANAFMALGTDLDQVRACLRGLGFPGSETYAYTPPGAPDSPPPFPPPGPVSPSS